MLCPQDRESEEFPFSSYLYCYKSFHSPLLDRDYPGLSLAQLEAAASRENSRKRDQRQAGGLVTLQTRLATIQIEREQLSEMATTIAFPM